MKSRPSLCLLLVLLALVLASCGSPSLGVRPDGSAPGTYLRPSIERPMSGERFSITGSTAGDETASVELEQQVDGAWRPAGRVRSSPSGRFAFDDLLLGAPSTTYRVVSARDDLVVGPLTVRRWDRAQRADLSTLPAVGADISRTTSSVGRGSAYVVAAFSPARPGRPVSIQRRTEGTWQVVDTLPQDANGTVRVAMPSGQTAGAWRAVAAARDGVPAASTGPTRPRPWRVGLAADFDGSDPDVQWQNRSPRTWRPTRTCAYTDSSAISRRDGVLNVVNEPVASIPRGMRGKSPTENAVDAICRDAHDDVRQFRGGSLIAVRPDGSRFEFTHGVAAARIRFSPHPGQHAAFWLQANNPKGTEIDTIESFGQGTTRPAVGIYYDGGRDKRRSQHVKISGSYPTGESDDWYRRFHTYAVTWTPDYYSFTIDGREVMRTTRGVRSDPHFVVLSNITADWEIQRNTGEPAAMQVDWVRVWQQGPVSRSSSADGSNADLVTPTE